MNLEDLKKRLKEFDISEIKTTKHGFERIQDRKRRVNYNKVVSLLTCPDNLYKFEEQIPKNPDELKFKLWFKLNYIFDLNVYIVINKEPEKGLNSLEIITVHKVKRKIQEKIEKNES